MEPGRRKHVVQIEDDNRDKGKVFILTEMDAFTGELWADRCLELISQSGVRIEPEAMGAGTAGLASVGINLAVTRCLQDPQLANLWDYIQYQHKPGQAPQPLLRGDAAQIEEIKTLHRLRWEFLNLQVGFFSAEKASTSASSSVASKTPA